MSGDTHYKDGEMGKNYTYYGTRYKDDSAAIRIDKDLEMIGSYHFLLTIQIIGMVIRLFQEIIKMLIVSLAVRLIKIRLQAKVMLL